jgi:hypothetical protein
MGLGATYKVETGIYAHYILQERPSAKIAVLYQNDDAGKDLFKGLKLGLGDKAAGEEEDHLLPGVSCVLEHDQTGVPDARRVRAGEGGGARAIGAVLRYLPTPSYFRSWHEA